MHCCLNPHCHHPPQSKSHKFCHHCGVQILPLRNRYYPLKFLGQGGFGKTYLAEDIDKLQAKCVIKQLILSSTNPSELAKITQLFGDEAKRLQELGDHPQIPSLLAYFKEDDYLYLVQEAIDGEDLGKEIKRIKSTSNANNQQYLPIFNEEQIHLFLQDLLGILSVVHQHQIVHRDIKPENIIRRHSDRQLVLIDFGISKQLTATAMSKAGTLIGTPGYTPLEQMSYGVAYPASDLYAVGATCFHLLSGIHPDEVQQSGGYQWTENWLSHIQQPLSQQLIKILDRLLQIEYQNRYRSIGELLPDLELLEIDIANNFSTFPTYKLTQNMTNLSSIQAWKEIDPDDWFKSKSDQNSLWRKFTKFLFEEH